MNSFTVETLGCVFTAIDGNIKILLMRKKTEPYKGYWILPGDKLTKEYTLEDNMIQALSTKVGYSNLNIRQCATFSDVDRFPNKRVLAVSYVSLIDSVSATLVREDTKEEVEWFDIDLLPKLGYDHADVIENALDYLRNSVENIDILRELFPSDFTLPEIQKVYECLSGNDVDRRNFRKKLIASGLIESTGDYQSGGNGRPAQLYSFITEN